MTLREIFFCFLVLVAVILIIINHVKVEKYDDSRQLDPNDFDSEEEYEEEVENRLKRRNIGCLIYVIIVIIYVILKAMRDS